MTERQKTRVKRALAMFISEHQQIPFPSAQDLVDTTENICHIVSYTKSYLGFNSPEQVIEEYLGLTDFYSDIFRP